MASIACYSFALGKIDFNVIDQLQDQGPDPYKETRYSSIIYWPTSLSAICKLTFSGKVIGLV